MNKELLVVVGLVFSGIVFASEPLKTDSLIRLDNVIVTANKISVNRNSVPLSVSVIQRDEIDASSESALLPVLSQRVPGLFVTQHGITGFGLGAGSGAAAGTINIRGVGGGNKVLVLFDGQPQWAGIFGHALPDTYVASDVEKVEVIRGPGSLLYGSNAMGGVVNIITRQHTEEGRRTQARVMYGSYNTQKYMINNGYNVGRFSSFVSVNHDRTDGHRPNSAFHITNGFLKLGYQFTPHYKMTADASLAKYKYRNPGNIADPIFDNIMDIFRGTATFALENQYDKMSGAIRAFYNWGDHKINDGYKQGEHPQEALFRSDDHNVGVLLYESFRLFEGNSFTLGLDYKNWGGKARKDTIDGGGRFSMVDKKVNEVAGYAIMQQDFFERLSANVGVRYEYNDQFGGEWVPQAGLTWRPFEGNAVKLSLAKGFRSPNIKEMFMFPPQNPDLKPESMMNYQASIEQFFLGGDLFAELTAFYIKGKDMILTRKIDDRMKNVNTGAFTNKGAEMQVRYRIRKDLNVDMNYSFLHMNNPIPGAPEHKLHLGATYAPGHFVFNLNTQSIYGLYTDTNATKQTDFTTLNARVSYRFGTRDKGVTLFVKGENLTATRYSIDEGYPMPKAVCMGGIDIVF